MNRDDYNLKKKINKFSVLATYIHETIGPEARKKGISYTNKELNKSVFLVIVEGKPDKVVYDEIFNRSNSVVIDLTCGESETERERKALNLFGKPAVQTLMEKSHHNNNPPCRFITRVRGNMALGLIDLDYDNYPSVKDTSCPNRFQPLQYRNLFSTETNDLETLLLEYGILNELLAKIFEESQNEQKESIEKFRDYVYFRIKFLNKVFRIATKKYNLSWKHVKLIDFKALCSIINTPDENLCDAFTSLVFHPESKNGNNRDIKEKFIRDITSEYSPQDLIKSPNIHFCQGHNTMTVLRCIYYKFLHFHISEKELFNRIWVICKKDKRFKKTQLFRSLLMWEDRMFPLKPAHMFEEEWYC